MHKVRPELFLINILLSTHKIQHSLKGIAYNQFVSNAEKFGFILRELQEIGESAKKLKNEPEFGLKTSINWRKIIQFRNIVVHRYFAISPQIVFEIATKEVPPLEQDVLELLKQTKDKTYILKAISGMKKVFKKINRKETVDHLSYLEYLLTLS